VTTGEAHLGTTGLQRLGIAEERKPIGPSAATRENGQGPHLQVLLCASVSAWAAHAIRRCDSLLEANVQGSFALRLWRSSANGADEGLRQALGF
jgi:hypothetical protein